MSGQALAEIGQGGQQPCHSTTFRSTACPASRARSPLPSGRRMCSLQVSKRLLPGGSCYLPRLVGRPGLQWSGTRPDRQRESRSSQRAPDALGIDGCGSGTGGGDALTFNLGAGYSDDEALCASPATASTWPTAAATGIGAGLLTGEMSRWRGPSQLSLRCHTDRGPNAVVLAHAPNEVQIAALQGLRDRAERLFAAQDHPRSACAAPEQWRLRGRLGERTSDER